MGTIRLRDVNDDGDERARLRGKELVRVWGEWLGRLPWEFFVTLTFDPKRRFPVDRELATKEAFLWLGVVGYATRRPIAWAYAVERGKSGLWHAHALVIGAGNQNWKTLEGVWRMRNGIAVVKPVHSARGISIYTTKARRTVR